MKRRPNQEQTKEPTSRVVMLWPADFKAQIQAEVGKRGLTAYVLEAVQLRRSQATPVPPGSRTAPPPARVEEAISDGVVPPVAHTGHCPTCQAELMDGVCWVCD